jgi:succinate-acetate transporter protein
VDPSESIIRITIKPYGSALPLGFFSFGVGMLLLGGIGVGWVHGQDEQTAGLLIAAFVFPLELVATVIAFLARDTASATSLGMFSTSWLAFGLALFTGEPGARSDALGLYGLMFGVMVIALSAAAFLGKPLLGILLGIASTRSILSGAWNLGAGQWAETAAGVIGIVIAGCSVYGGLAFLLEDLKQAPVLPLLRIGAARESFEGDLQAQLERVETEAGVRQQL